VTVPNTVMGALVENGTYQDPYEGSDIRDLPGMRQAPGQGFRAG